MKLPIPAAAVGFLSLLFLDVQAGFAADKVLYSFQGGSDGNGPLSPLITDGKGNLYGTTIGGGGSVCYGADPPGCGTVFKLTPNHEEKLLYAFGGGNDGAYPEGGLISDQAGNLYGTTVGGGGAEGGTSTVFKLSSKGTKTILHTFQSGADGIFPSGTLVSDQSGNLYGTTLEGGGTDCGGVSCGTVFEVTPSGSETVLYAFKGGTDGAIPEGGVILDANGNLYGTTAQGGTYDYGTVFKLAQGGVESILYSFKGGNDGAGPASGLLMDSLNNLYGTTSYDGASSCACGTVFELTGNGTETPLYSFQGGNDGDFPISGVVMDAAGNLYGTTLYGGGKGCNLNSGCGVIFKLPSDGDETVVYALHGHHGSYPHAALLLSNNGHLLGTAAGGGTSHAGVVFEIR